MAKLLISLTPSPPFTPSTRASFKPPHVPFTSLPSRKSRGLSVVTGAGPTTNQLIFAFVLPLSLVAFTVFTSIRIADKLDRDYLEEVAINQAIRETEEDDELDMSSKEKSALPRTRNRPKKEV